jgi:transcriptional regulator with XRE-family HTH domain
MKEIALKIKFLLKLHELTYEQFAKKIGKSKPTVINYLNGKSKIDVGTLKKIAEVLNVQPEYFFESTSDIFQEPTGSYKRKYLEERLDDIENRVENIEKEIKEIKSKSKL